MFGRVPSISLDLQIPIYTTRVYVCVCVFIFFHHEVFFRLQDVQGILESTDQRSCVVNISWVLSAKFHYLRIWKCHISPPKTKTLADSLLERKQYDIMCSKKRWYILIQDISRSWPKANKWRKDTKDKEATLI